MNWIGPACAAEPISIYRSMMKHYPVILLLAAALIAGCGPDRDLERPEKILARVDGKTISVNEFIRRAEYTPRPPYCSSESYPHKKIVLNSLVAEKLFALEAGEKNPLITSPKVEAFLKGRKEQAMREYLFIKEAYDKAQIDTTTLKRAAVNASRRYRIAYFNVPDSAAAAEIEGSLRRRGEPMLAAMQSFAPLDSLPQREVVWDKTESDAVIDSLFLVRRQAGDLIGPLRSAPGHYLFMQVLEVKPEVVLTNEQLREIWNSVKERLTDKVARANWDQYILSVMQGRRIEFSRSTFFKLADLLGPLYLKNRDEQEASFEQRYWEGEEKDVNWDDYLSQLQAMAGEPLFKVDGEVWDVERFAREVRSHPLVFREKKIRNRDFGRQLQLAIIDMVRDRYLTDRAYKRGYDRLSAVEREVGMWRDYYNYLFFRDGYLRTMGDSIATDPHFLQTIERHLNAKVDSLQRKYSDRIEINLEELEKITLTRIHMSVAQENVPYPKVVPAFPQVTTSFRLDYGKKME